MGQVVTAHAASGNSGSFLYTHHMAKTRRHGHHRKSPWTGWAKKAPNTTQRRKMMKRCRPKGKCFLGPKLSFPVCAKNTCKVSKKGAWAAYIRARQWGGPARAYVHRAHPRHGRRTYRDVARKALKIIHSRKRKTKRRQTRRAGKRRRR